MIEYVDNDGSTNRFTQLQTGLNRWSETDQQFVPASDEVESVNGVALARKTQYQVIFGATLDALEGTVDLMMLGGQRLRVRPMGLAYTEFKGGQPGPSVFVAETKDAAFQVSGRSEVTYPDALTGGASGSIRYRVSIGGLEQDLVSVSALPPPSQLQMNEALVRVEVWNEILESPPSETQTVTIVREDGSADRDDQVQFGPMLLGSGTVIDAATTRIRVARHWQDIEGKLYLIESVPYAELKRAKLPIQEARSQIDQEKLNKLWAKQSGLKRSRPVSLSAVV